MDLLSMLDIVAKVLQIASAAWALIFGSKAVIEIVRPQSPPPPGTASSPSQSSLPSSPRTISRVKHSTLLHVGLAIVVLIASSLITFFLGSQSPSFTITSPTAGSQVSITTTVEGTASNIPPGKELWLLVESKGRNGYFPQGGNTDTPSPIVVSSNGTWKVDAYIGQNDDSGRLFVLHIALVDQKGRDAIDHYFASGRASHHYSPLYPLPGGIQMLIQVDVIRN